MSVQATITSVTQMLFVTIPWAHTPAPASLDSMETEKSALVSIAKSL